MRIRWSRPVLVVGIAAVATAAAAVLLRPWGAGDAPAPTPAAPDRPAAMAALVARTEDRVARVPGDWQAWAELGMGRVQLARVTADPRQYPRAEEALRRSLALRPAPENASALTGLAALAAARHDFAAAVEHARQAVRVDPYSADAYGTLADALIEVGRPQDGFAAVQKMVDLRPDTSSFARASYTYELRGDLPRARELMAKARTVATDPSDVTFTLTHLGALAVAAGDPDTAASIYAEGLARQPDDAGLLFGRGRLAYLRGDPAAAVADLRAAVDAAPTPEHATALGELLTEAGDEAGARDAFDLVRAAAAVGSSDVDLVLFWADHGDPARAVREARALYAGRKSTVVADAYAWALHRAGRSDEAVTYADAALRLGTRDPRALFHRGMIRRATGSAAGARADLAEALRLNPRFAPVHASAARAALAELGA